MKKYKPQNNISSVSLFVFVSLCVTIEKKTK